MRIEREVEAKVEANVKANVKATESVQGIQLNNAQSHTDMRVAQRREVFAVRQRHGTED